MIIQLKILFIITAFLIVPIVGFGQTEVKPKYAPRKEKHRNKKDELDRKQGLWKHYNYLGTLVWEIEYLDGKRNGISRRYYSNGKIMRETEYFYDIKNGIFQRYNFNGIVVSGEYSDGKKSGHWINYFSNQQIKSEGNYKNGYKAGEWRYFNRKGIEVNRIFFQDGKIIRDTVPAKHN